MPDPVRRAVRTTRRSDADTVGAVELKRYLVVGFSMVSCRCDQSTPSDATAVPFAHCACRVSRAPSVVRSAALRGLRGVVAELGGDADRLAQFAGLDPRVLDTDEVRIPARSVDVILEAGAQWLECPDLALRVAARQDLSVLGPLSLGIGNSPTLQDAYDLVQRFLRVHTNSVEIALQSDPHDGHGVAALTYTTAARRTGGCQATDLGLGFIHRAICAITGPQYGLRSVELPHLPQAPVAVYEAFFDAPVRIGAPVGMLRVPRAVLRHRPPQEGSRRLQRCIEALLTEQLPRSDSNDIAARTREAIHRSLSDPNLDIAIVARGFSVHPRTLQRWLAEEATTFNQLVEAVRQQEAWHYLTSTDMPMARIAVMLGLPEQSALSHRCQRWWSASPSQIRRDHGAMDDASVLKTVQASRHQATAHGRTDMRWPARRHGALTLCEQTR